MMAIFMRPARLRLAGGSAPSASAKASADKSAGPGDTRAGEVGEACLVARDDKKNPLISTFVWTDEAVQRIFRVPAGFMRNKTQERVEELARERAASGIDLALVEAGIEFGKKMMAEMISTYSAPGASPAAEKPAGPKPVSAPDAAAGGGYLNEVRSH